MMDDGNNESTKPRTLACGYRSIISSKTGLEFPAWLLHLPPRDVLQQNHNSCWWRSKRDFLLLGRAAKRAGCKRLLPKAAMEKLSERAPWRRPDVHESALLEDSKYHVSMKKNLARMDQFLEEIAERCSSEGEDLGSSLTVAWDVFCRRQDTSGLVNPRDHDERLYTSTKTKGTTSLQESSRLGQYFCTPENATLVVQHALKWGNKCLSSKDVLFLEPSCGHGEVVKSLLHQLDQSRCMMSGAITIVAYDIDPKAIEYNKRWDKTGRVQWRVGDFLASAPSQADRFVIVLGGPPYTTGAGSGRSMRRDLPQQFWTHSVDVWNAQFVALLLPVRYAGSTLEISPDWNCETHSLVSSKFFLQGSIEVAQPSVLQTFCRKHVDDCAAYTQS
jgi:hypothetical protein